MPVTAKLSLRFYEKLGEDVANELVEWFNSVDATYRSDLKELNELNFARFDAKLEQRLAELRSELRSVVVLELNDFRKELDGRFAELQKEIAAVRLESVSTINALRAELIKWAFVFFATAALAVIGLR